MGMNRIYVRGLGAVSPAGWGLPALRSALARGEPLPTTAVSRPAWDKPLSVREVPAPVPRPAFLAHPRLRRASPITLYLAGAVSEAYASALAAGVGPPRVLGLVICTLAGCVQYSCRFFAETLQDPATASPVLFPETVVNAPASHLGALLGQAPVACTLLGDAATFLQGLALAADWLLDGKVEVCLVAGAEEIHWLLADVLWHFDRRAELAGGAGALCLAAAPAGSGGVELGCVTSPQRYSTSLSRREAVERVRAELPAETLDELLCQSARGNARVDSAEEAAWRDWSAARLRPKATLGEGLTAAGAWQCVAACDALAQGRFRAANVSVAGLNDQAIGARFARVGD
jgi:3-oxoacyl-(acyl-carrier-protein) synthase